MSYDNSYYNPPPSVQNSSMAIISLIAGLLGLFVFPLIGSIVAVITGGMAKKEIQSSGGMMGGDGMATAGLILGWIGIGLWVIGGCIVGAIVLLPLCLVPLGLSMEEFNSLLPMLLAI
ncbi:MAG: DUF4190 domain-containing protein [Anaerolineales bacterium]|nr:DUF4190 domain-containing protein [Anaerolineales bacterium]